MGRRAREFDYSMPFHVVSRCINHEWFSLKPSETWEVMQRHLYFTAHAFGFEILAFVLMSNHYHMLLLAPGANLSEGMAWFGRETSRELVSSSGRINMTYGGRFFRSNIQSHHHFLNCYKYIFRNPVEAGLAERVEEYRWSTLRGLLGFEHLLIPVREDLTLFDDLVGSLHWLNEKPSAENWDAIRKGLRHPIFRLANDRNTKRNHALETDFL